jgi:hypothetical protein
LASIDIDIANADRRRNSLHKRIDSIDTGKPPQGLRHAHQALLADVCACAYPYQRHQAAHSLTSDDCPLGIHRPFFVETPAFAIGMNVAM